MKAAMARHIALAINEGEYDEAIHVIEGSGSINAPRKDDSVNEAMDEMMTALKAMGERVEAINDQLRGIDANLTENMYWVPNMPHESVPVFDSEEHNIPWTPEGPERTYEFEPKPHWELGPELGIIDFERGVKLAGSRAYVLKGWGARLQRALISFYLDMAREKDLHRSTCRTS